MSLLERSDFKKEHLASYLVISRGSLEQQMGSNLDKYLKKNLQDMFRHTYAIFSCEWVVQFEFKPIIL